MSTLVKSLNNTKVTQLSAFRNPLHCMPLQTQLLDSALFSNMRTSTALRLSTGLSGASAAFFSLPSLNRSASNSHHLHTNNISSSLSQLSIANIVSGDLPESKSSFYSF